MFDVKLKELLESWGFGHLFQYFTDEEITLKRINYITEDRDHFSTSSTINNNLFSKKSFLDIDIILSEHPSGNCVQRALNEGNNLNDVTRKILVEAIVTYIIKNKIKPSRSDFERISSDIEAQFNDDKLR
ncbi:uncharacterized protein LOC128261790 isoform X2 [Drosophila gunungcola]|uniref:uncharacterized protein LOC128261790 isoform X2 n=1 Tax=Drosophila gunungcola TaxID=103775 RepID=UPI0022E3B7CF|nr:uncharacterized protein LOC128261790 isoform X2 [Drosophila gunungcola]